jgi:hypothetical protein
MLLCVDRSATGSKFLVLLIELLQAVYLRSLHQRKILLPAANVGLAIPIFPQKSTTGVPVLPNIAQMQTARSNIVALASNPLRQVSIMFKKKRSVVSEVPRESHIA